MKKKLCKIVAAVSLIAVCLTGCGKGGAKGTVSTDGSTSIDMKFGNYRLVCNLHLSLDML